MNLRCSILTVCVCVPTETEEEQILPHPGISAHLDRKETQNKFSMSHFIAFTSRVALIRLFFCGFSSRTSVLLVHTVYVYGRSSPIVYPLGVNILVE